MINILKGLNEVISPASPAHQDGTLSTCENMYVDIDGTWKQSASASPSNPARSVIADNGTAYTTSTIFSSGIAALAAPAVALHAGTGARMESGIYYYIVTNTGSGCEGVASGATEHYVQRNFNGEDGRVNDIPSITTVSGYNVYRTKVIYVYKGATIQRVQQNDPTEFFFVGQATGITLLDYLHDNELGRPYEGRGSIAVTSPAVIQRFDGRIFAFYSSATGNIARYSGVGKPLEFAQNHNILYTMKYTSGTSKWDSGTFNEALKDDATSSNTTTVEFVPILENGVRGETKLWMPELVSKTIIDAYEFHGKLWVWSADTTGYITPSNGGYKYVHVSEDFGMVSGTLDLGDGALYGCDIEGAWVIDGDFPRKISEGIVSDGTIISGSWSNSLKSYTYATTVTGYSAGYFYNARLGTITTRFMLETASPVWNSEMLFWIKGDEGQVKEDLIVTIIADGTFKATIYQGEFPSTTFCTNSGEYSFADAKRINVIEPNNSGRYTGIKLTAAPDAGFILYGINIEASGVNKYERATR